MQTWHSIKLHKISIICTLLQPKPSTRALDCIPTLLRGSFIIIPSFFLSLASSIILFIRLVHSAHKHSQEHFTLKKKNPSILPPPQTTILSPCFLHWQTWNKYFSISILIPCLIPFNLLSHYSSKITFFKFPSYLLLFTHLLSPDLLEIFPSFGFHMFVLSRWSTSRAPLSLCP